MTRTRTLKIGIAPYHKIKERTVAIARGTYKPTRDDPKVWFTSLDSLAQILSTNNKLLIEIIAKSHPSSLEELAKLSGRAKGNLSRTLHTMERYGLISLMRGERGRIVPQIVFERVRFDVDLTSRTSVAYR